jgi:hypothetical protein
MRLINWIYGIAIILVALDAMLFGLIPSNLLGFIVALLGVLVVTTKLSSGRAYLHQGIPVMPLGVPRPRFQWLRRWFFGIFMIVSGVLSIVGIATEFLELQAITIYSLSGQLILIGIGLIYLFAGTKHAGRKMPRPF